MPFSRRVQMSKVPSRSTPISVLFLHAGDNWIRGSENALLTLMTGVERDRINPVLLSSNPELVKRAQGIDARSHPLPEIMIDGPHVRLQAYTWVKAFRKICSIIDEQEIDVVYCNGGSTCQVGYYAAKRKRKPVICHVHSPYNRRYIVFYRIHRASKVIFVSEAIRRLIENKQRLRGESEVVYNGVDIKRFCPAPERDPRWRERLGIPPQAVVFGQVASLIHRKGIDVLLRACEIARQSCPYIHLLLVGEGEQRRNYELLADELGITDCVTFVGVCDDPVPFYQHVVDVNVLASRSEALPLSLIEAAACGLPNIASRVGGIPEAVADGRTGILFESENCDVLAQEMIRLGRDARLRGVFGAAGRKHVVERFSATLYCRSIEQHIIQCANRPVHY